MIAIIRCAFIILGFFVISIGAAGIFSMGNHPVAPLVTPPNGAYSAFLMFVGSLITFYGIQICPKKTDNTETQDTLSTATSAPN